MIREIRGLKINYEVIGKGKNIIFLHGWGGNLHSLHPIAKQINYRSILIDLPGFGKSDIPDRIIDSFEYAEIINELIDSFNLSEAVLVGHSFGGKIATIIASKNPKWLRGLVIIASPGIKIKKDLKTLLKIYTYKFLKKIVSLFPQKEKYLEKLKKKFGSEDYRNAKDIMREILKKVINEDISNILSKINCKTLLIWGKKDKAVPKIVGQKFNELIKESKLVMYENAGHFPYLENFERFISDLNNFLSEVYKNG
ncbi:MAG: alpha/beta hydrolase [Thermosipho sp. (in: Bacteria)]|nr:alpha/beta hydrolase [Thermosipho sp. (in: thermotogales)]